MPLLFVFIFQRREKKKKNKNDKKKNDFPFYDNCDGQLRGSGTEN